MRAVGRQRSTPKALLRALLVLATSTLVVCGVKGPPRPPESGAELADAGPADGGAK
jgi:predicted small lipoprotein YifL